MVSRLLSQLKRLPSTAVFWSGILTLVRACGFVVVLPFILRKLPTAEVGLWYIFSTIAGICAMVEVGFAPVISRFTSYYLAGYQFLPGLRDFASMPQDNRPNMEGLYGLLRMSQQLYYKFAAALFLAMTVGGGAWLFWKYHDTFTQPHILIAFLIYAAGSTWSMAEYFWIDMLYGANRVRICQILLMEALFFNYAITLIALSLHLGILSLVLGQLAMALYQRLRAHHLFHRFFTFSPDMKPMPIRWQHLWPMTWRSGLTRIGMALPLYLSTLLCAQLFGIESAARFGLSMALISMTFSLSNSWLAVKWPELSAMWAQNKIRELRCLFLERLAMQMASYFLISVMAWWLAPQILTFLKTKTNFIEPTSLALLLLAGAMDLFVGSFITIIQSKNQYPFIQSLTINIVLTAILALTLGKYYGLNGMICSLMIAQLLYNIWHVLFHSVKIYNDSIR